MHDVLEWRGASYWCIVAVTEVPERPSIGVGVLGDILSESEACHTQVVWFQRSLQTNDSSMRRVQREVSIVVRIVQYDRRVCRECPYVRRFGVLAGIGMESGYPGGYYIATNGRCIATNVRVCKYINTCCLHWQKMPVCNLVIFWPRNTSATFQNYVFLSENDVIAGEFGRYLVANW